MCARRSAKGLWERAVVVKHALRNALLPIVTVIGLEFAFLIGGLVVTEQVLQPERHRHAVRRVDHPA